MHKIKEIDFEAIQLLLPLVKYKHSTNAIQLAKGKNKLPVTFEEMFKQFKMMING